MKHVLHAGKIVVWCAIIALCGLSLLVNFRSIQSAQQAGGGLSLQPPAFLKSVHAADSTAAITATIPVDFSFLVKEAGITAYTKLNKPLDLETLAPLFKTKGRQTADFISGIVTAPDYETAPKYEEKAEVQVFVHKDGWILAYLTKWQRGAELFDWVHYDDKRLKNSTLIENVVRYLAENAGASDVAVSYYDFRYPDATNLLLIASHADTTNPQKDFEVNVPLKLTVYESSWSHNGIRLYGSNCKLDDKDISYFSRTDFQFGTNEFTKDTFPQGKTHYFSAILSAEDSQARTYCGVAIVYKEVAK